MFISMRRTAKLSALVLLGLVSVQAGAADGTTYGVGAGASGGGASIYFPIRTGSLILEPLVSYNKTEEKTAGTGSGVLDYPPGSPFPDVSVPISSETHDKYQSEEIGLGIFLKNQITDEIEVYGGSRLGYLTLQRRNQRSSDYAAGNGYVNNSFSELNRKQTGYFFAPAVGMQYFPRANFSLGIELSFKSSYLSGHETRTEFWTSNDPNASADMRSVSGKANTHTYSTLTAAILRGYF